MRVAGQPGQPGATARPFPPFPAIPTSENDSEVGEAQRMPFPARARTGERLTLRQDEEAALDTDSDHKLPDPDDLPRFPQEMAGLLQFCSLGHGQGPVCPTNLP